MIETDRLRLRKFEEKDLSSILKIYGNPQINRFLPWFPLKNMEEAKAFLEKEKTKKLSFAICLKEDDIPIGYIKVSEDDSHDLGYGLLPEYQKKGIMTEAGKALIQYLQSLFIPFITATHDKNNPKSGNVMKRLNMKYLYS